MYTTHLGWSHSVGVNVRDSEIAASEFEHPFVQFQSNSLAKDMNSLTCPNN